MVDVATTAEVGFGIIQNWIGIAATVVGFSVFTGIIWKISKKWTSIETKQDQQHDCIERLEGKIDKTVEVELETKNELKKDIASIAAETKAQTIKLVAIDEKVEYNDESSKSLAQGMEKQSDFFTKWLQRIEDVQIYGGVRGNGQLPRIARDVIETHPNGVKPDVYELERQLLDIQNQLDRVVKRNDTDSGSNDYRIRNISARRRGIFNKPKKNSKQRYH